MNRKRLGGGDGDGVVMVLTFMFSLTLEKIKEKKRYIRFCVTCKSVCCFW